MKPTMSILFISVNVLSIFDKILTWFGLQNSGMYELNPLVNSVIGKFGLTLTMILYSLGGFVLFYMVYRIVIMKRLSCEKHNISPETFFLMLNVIFFLIVINNLLWMFHKE
jgi:hypothetical protein